MSDKGARYIAKAIVAVGFAAVSVWAWSDSNGAIGAGWAFLAVLALVW